MPLRIRSLMFGVLALLLCSTLYGASDLASARRDYKKKDYAAAFKLLAPLVKRGDPGAEVLMGRMYLMGHGVLRDPTEAYKLFHEAAQQGNADGEFYIGAKAVLSHEHLASGLDYLRLSAEQGNKDAQLLLGKTYLRGIGSAVRPDPARADMWLRLAARSNLPFYRLQLEGAERQMTAQQIAVGKALAAKWKAKHGLKPPANPGS